MIEKVQLACLEKMKDEGAVVLIKLDGVRKSNPLRGLFVALGLFSIIL